MPSEGGGGNDTEKPTAAAMVSSQEMNPKNTVKATFFLGSSTFSVYEEMARQLTMKPRRTVGCDEKQGGPPPPQPDAPFGVSSLTATTATTGHRSCMSVPPDREATLVRWRQCRSVARLPHCDVVLGDRFAIPYASLRVTPLPHHTLFRGVRWVNYFQDSHRLTLKASMAPLLQSQDPLYHATYMPETYVLGGDLTQKGKRKDQREAFLEAVQRLDRMEARNQMSRLSPIEGSEGVGGEYGRSQKFPSSDVGDDDNNNNSMAGSSLWIIKPSTGAKGVGIRLLRGEAAAREFVQKALPALPPSLSTSSTLPSPLPTSTATPKSVFSLIELHEREKHEDEAERNNNNNNSNKNNEDFPRDKPHTTTTTSTDYSPTSTIAARNKKAGLTSPSPPTGTRAVRYVAQAYITRPLLLRGRRKFDIRVWVLLQSPYSIFVFSQGSCRTASTPYQVEDVDAEHLSAHITNHCLQEGVEGYGRYEANNELFFPELEAYLNTGPSESVSGGDSSVQEKNKRKDENAVGDVGERQTPWWWCCRPSSGGAESSASSSGVEDGGGGGGAIGGTSVPLLDHPLRPSPSPSSATGGKEVVVVDPHDDAKATMKGGASRSGGVLETYVLPQMAAIITRTLLIMKPTLQLLPSDEAEAFRCFQLFGYDLMVTDTLEVKLLEINGSPGIAERFLTPLVREMIRKLYYYEEEKKEEEEGEGEERAAAAAGFESAPLSRSSGGCAKHKVYPLQQWCGGGGVGVPPAGDEDSGEGLPRGSTTTTAPTTTATTTVSPCAVERPTRRWRIDTEEFVLLWEDGVDPLPVGISIS